MSKEIREEQFKELVLKEDNILKIVDFHAVWCNPCKMLAPVLDELQVVNSDIEIYSMDVDQNSRIADELDINSVPSIFFYKNGKIEKILVGFHPLPNLQAEVDNLK